MKRLSRRSFGKRLVATCAAGIPSAQMLSEASTFSAQGSGPVIDTHMHVWSDDAARYPFSHPYIKDFQRAPHPGTLEMLIEDMDQNGCTHAVLVQVIFHGWDNQYIADCIRKYPKRLRGHGLIDPTGPNVADRLEFAVKEQGLHGMRFSPIYYRDGQHGGDSWLDAEETHKVWRKARELNSIFNFFISPGQLPRLEKMVRTHPEVRIIIDHLSQVDLKQDDPEPDFRNLLALAKYPNVWVKVSELSSVSRSGKYPFADSFPHVRRVYEAFGPDRLLFGTGYPGSARFAYKRPTLAQEIRWFRTEIPFLSTEDREKILGRNAARLWGFS